MMRLENGERVFLVEALREDRDPSGYPLMDLFYEDPGGQRHLVLRELAHKTEGAVFDPEVAASTGQRGWKMLTYGDYAEESREFCRALLEVWGDGDRHGIGHGHGGETDANYSLPRRPARRRSNGNAS